MTVHFDALWCPRCGKVAAYPGVYGEYEDGAGLDCGCPGVINYDGAEGVVHVFEEDEVVP